MLKQIAVRLEEDLIKQIKLRALENNMSMQDVIARATMQYLHPAPKEAPNTYKLTLAPDELRALANATFNLYKQAQKHNDVVIQTPLKGVEKL